MRLLAFAFILFAAFMPWPGLCQDTTPPAQAARGTGRPAILFETAVQKTDMAFIEMARRSQTG